MTESPYAFRTAIETDLPLIERWLKERHVAKWWGKPAVELEVISGFVHGRDADRAHPLMMLLDGAPAGYLQWYEAQTDPELPPQRAGTRGIDFFIGETAMLGKGHGPGFIRHFAELCRADGVARLLADPDGRNIGAVGCLGRAGFTPEGLIGPPAARRLLMVRDLAPTQAVTVERPVRTGRRRNRERE